MIMKQWLYPGPTISYLIGFLGLGFSMSGLPFTLRIIIVCVSLLILLITAAIKLEEYLKKRHQRRRREEIYGFKVFLKFAEKHSEDFEDLDEKAIEDIEEAHEEFRKRE
jgi:hypothetical protein